MSNKSLKKPNVNKKEKKIVKNSMFLRSAHHYIFVLLLILISFLVIAFNNQIEESGQQVAIYFQKINLVQLDENYKEQINLAVADYFSQRNALELSDQNATEDKKILNDQIIDELQNLKLVDDLRDFHLDLLLIFNKLKLADQKADNDLYTQAQSSLQSLADNNPWFNYQ